ncbi:MAG: 50S ribosomal protein L10 [Planctomycetaceae bacterium]|jgi:large subunit ribosomal protein L10|nr:50S ribosomal protein L10 [Planctomycetaceae bacterium]
MSKFVKNLISEQLRTHFDGVSDAFLVSFTGLNANTNARLRTQFAEKGVRMTVIKNSLARRAAEGMPLAPLFQNMTGSLAVCWGSTDIVGLAKELVKVMNDKQYAGFVIFAGIMGGEVLTAAQSVDVSKWPSREEQISLLVGQMIGVGSKLSGQLIGIGGALASQIKQIAEKESHTEVAA